LRRAALLYPGEDAAGESSGYDTRRQQLLSFIRDHEFARIYDLARQFGVSEVTIRSDVDILTGTGGIRRVHRRVHGRAMRVRPTPKYKRPLPWHYSSHPLVRPIFTYVQ
jgi:predicted ArsR family transcriptional regulator